jgi:hypothetical protein
MAAITPYSIALIPRLLLLLTARRSMTDRTVSGIRVGCPLALAASNDETRARKSRMFVEIAWKNARPARLATQRNAEMQEKRGVQLETF